jgi:transposase-like protein
MKKLCSVCTQPLQKRGLTAAGTQRWYCSSCASSTVRKRPDTQVRHRRTLFTRWLTGNRSWPEIAHDHGVSRRTLIRWFTPLWERIQTPIETFVPHAHSSAIRCRIFLPSLTTRMCHERRAMSKGVNSRLKELVHRHRVLPQDRKQVLVAEHLARKQGGKPPRNVT